MTLQELKKSIRLNWITILVIGSFAGTILLIIGVTSLSLFHFFHMDSNFQKSVLAGMSSYIFLWLVVGSLTGVIHTVIWVYFVFGGGFAKLTYKRIKEGETNVSWPDVIGMETVKKEVWEAITLLKDRARLKQIGGQIIKGILMVGPPGCGKTYLAKAIATETKLPFLPAVGSDFVGMFVGSGTMAMKNLFKKARILAEIHGGCLIFIDEIDSFARPRQSDRMGNVGAETAHNATINQLLADMDGIKQSASNIVILAATNLSEDDLDPALMRAGRFDRKIYVGRPTLGDRKQLFDFYLQKIQHDSSIDTNVLARRSVMFSAADVANMVKEASLVAVRDKRKQVVYKDLSEAYDRVLFGLKSHMTLSTKEKVWTAYHESGHAIIAYLTHPTDDVVKASIIPRKGMLGFIAPRPKEEIHAPAKDWYLANIKTGLAGYAAEKIKFGTTTSGVGNDFKNAMALARVMVFNYGMGPSGILGDFDAMFDCTGFGSQLNISEETKRLIDKDIQKILHDCLKEVEEILVKENDLFEHFAQELLKQGELEYDDIVEIFKKYGKERAQESSG
ncbi:MAG: AAA family ATPase [Omnitrophica bacterium]|nr:AAA family ATPase [Candidatus Omnitrophota bacterium]